MRLVGNLCFYRCFEHFPKGSGGQFSLSADVVLSPPGGRSCCGLWNGMPRGPPLSLGGQISLGARAAAQDISEPFVTALEPSGVAYPLRFSKLTWLQTALFLKSRSSRYERMLGRRRAWVLVCVPPSHLTKFSWEKGKWRTTYHFLVLL